MGGMKHAQFKMKVVSDVLLLSAQAVAKERNLSLETIHGEDIPLICANIPGLREVFSNLIDNALKYTPAGGKVTVEVKNVKNSVEIVFKDTGYGIARSDQERIFQRHYRGVQAGGDIPGTGLGLAIAKELISSKAFPGAIPDLLVVSAKLLC